MPCLLKEINEDEWWKKRPAELRNMCLNPGSWFGECFSCHQGTWGHPVSKVNFDSVIDLRVNGDKASLRNHTGVFVETPAMWCKITLWASIKIPEMCQTQTQKPRSWKNQKLTQFTTLMAWNRKPPLWERVYISLRKHRCLLLCCLWR